MTIPPVTRTSWLSAAASRDFEEIIEFTSREFGERQARRYGAILTTAIQRLTQTRPALPSRAQDALGPGIRSVMAGRHTLYFRVVDRDVVVLRILHAAMDPARHLEPPPD